MSRTRRNHEPGTKASTPWDRARQAAAQVKPVAARLKPLARSTGAAAMLRVHKTRAWAAPQVERTGRVLQDSAAPRVSALLSAAARRLEPATPRRRKPEVTTSAAEADADDVTPAAEMRDLQGTTSTDADADADVNRPIRTS